MRKLSIEERELIDRRRARLDKFIYERMPVLTEFIGLLGLPEPPRVLLEAEKYLPEIDLWIKTEKISDQVREWVILRVGYYIGEYLIQRHGGYWFLNEQPDTRTFGRYVVGGFTRDAKPGAAVEPFDVAADYVDQPPGRSLTAMLNMVEEEMRTE